MTGPLLLTASIWLQTFTNPDDLLKQVQVNQKKMEQIRENYTFHRIRKTEDIDAKGKVLSTTTEEREIFFVNRWSIGRLVKRNGQELPEKERKAEDQRVTKRVQECMKKEPPRNRGNAGINVSQILESMALSNQRRLVRNSRASLVFDFTADPKKTVKGINPSKQMAGSIWIDEADRQVARIEVRFFEDFKVGGGLVRD